MALAKKDIDVVGIAQEALNRTLVDSVVKQEIKIAHLEDKQFELKNELKKRDETINQLSNDIENIKEDKKWNSLWQDSLNEDIHRTELLVLVVGVINILFAFFISR